MSDTAHCPCGCGTVVDPPPKTGNVWLKSRNYWEFVCGNNECEAALRAQCNQTGDHVCPWCRSTRRLVGHFLSGGAHRRYRITVTGKRIRRPASGDTLSFTPQEGRDLGDE